MGSLGSLGDPWIPWRDRWDLGTASCFIDTRPGLARPGPGRLDRAPARPGVRELFFGFFFEIFMARARRAGPGQSPSQKKQLFAKKKKDIYIYI